jgi:hypothetical protein
MMTIVDPVSLERWVVYVVDVDRLVVLEIREVEPREVIGWLATDEAGDQPGSVVGFPP